VTDGVRILFHFNIVLLKQRDVPTKIMH